MSQVERSASAILAGTAYVVAALVVVAVPAVFFLIAYLDQRANLHQTFLVALATAVAGAISLALFHAFPLRRVREIEQELRFRAEHDILTGLANRGSLPGRLAEAIARARRATTGAAVMFLDLDDFKSVNDTMGHAAGDQLLREVAARLRESVRLGDTVARLGGDEFALVFDNMTPGAAATVAASLLARVRKPYTLAGQRHDLTCCIGIAMFPGDSSEPEPLLGYANTAMQDCKRHSKADFAFYSRAMQGELESRVRRHTLVRRAWERRQFTLHYQAICDIREGRLTGAEALMRCGGDELESMPTQEFVAALEEMGLIGEVGDWVIRQACLQACAWADTGLPNFVVSVNVSPRHFRGGEALVASVRAALAESGLEANRLQVEITESAMMEHRAEALLTINQLKALGVSIAVDDFGTGYSSLSYLKYFPVDALKIDRCFVSELSEEAAESNIVVAIVQLARGLKMDVIAEGVETAPQMALLQRYGCDKMQGYALGMPSPPDVFARDFLKSAEWLERTGERPIAKPRQLTEKEREDREDRTVPVRG